MPRRSVKRSAGLSVATVVLVACANSGCGEKFCVEGLDIGTTYKVTVLDPANANSQYGVQTSQGPSLGTNVSDTQSCGEGFDFVAGATFLIEPISKQDLMGCYGRIAVPSDLGGVQLAGQTGGPTEGGGVLMQTPTFQASFSDGCVGQWQLGFISVDQAPPLKAPVPGEYPPVLLLRTFQPTGAVASQSCPLLDSKLAVSNSCDDYFVVKLEKT